MAKSMRSPKNKYCEEIVFDSPCVGIGSVVEYTSNSIEELKAWLMQYAPGYIRIFENKSVYPDFDWQKIEAYEASK